MRKWIKGILLMVVTVLALAACNTGVENNEATNNANNNVDDGDVKVGLAVSTLNNPFFVTLSDGVKEAAEAAGYDVVVADAQDDAATQLADVEDLLQQNIDILIINPTDSEAVVSAVELANEKDVPVITVDRSSEGGEVVAHIASDNVAGGEMAGEFIADQLDDKGKVVELEGIPGASATRERGEGFHNIVDELDDIEIPSSQTANFDRTEGLTVMENIIQNSSDIDAVFAHNDEMALGALEALKSSNLDDVIVVGFDATDDAQEAVSQGEMAATVAQQPELIGTTAIDVVEKVLAGEDVDDFVPVDLELVTE